MVNIWPFSSQQAAPAAEAPPARSVPVEVLSTAVPGKQEPFSVATRIDVDALPNASLVPPVIHQTSFDGERYAGGFGPTEDLWVDHHTMRVRSRQLFSKNLYARGLLRRLITNEVNRGLHLEATPDNLILGIDEGDLEDWAEGVENRFLVWRADKRVVDPQAERDLGQIEADKRLTELIEGDVLVILRANRATGLPMPQLVAGSHVMTPFPLPQIAEGHTLDHGVERNAQKQHVAYYIEQDGGGFKRIPAYGRGSGRRQAWLSYGTDKLIDDVRGTPMLGLIMQSMQELDRYKDAALRKAVLNAIVTMSVESEQAAIGSKFASRAAAANFTAQTTDSDGTTRERQVSKFKTPGLIVEEMAQGEKLKVHENGADVNLGPFEDAIVRTMAWVHEVPPAIMTLGFSSNYAASQGEIKEFKMYLDKQRGRAASSFNKPLYQEWVLIKVARGDIKAPGLVEASTSVAQYELWGAWTSSDWSGAIKPSTDLLKETKGYKLGIEMGLVSHDTASKELHGRKFSHVIKKIKKENEQLVEAMTPLWEAQQKFKTSSDSGQESGPAVEESAAAQLEDIVEDLLIDEITGEYVVVRGGEVVVIADADGTLIT